MARCYARGACAAPFYSIAEKRRRVLRPASADVTRNNTQQRVMMLRMARDNGTLDSAPRSLHVRYQRCRSAGYGATEEVLWRLRDMLPRARRAHDAVRIWLCAACAVIFDFAARQTAHGASRSSEMQRCALQRRRRYGADAIVASAARAPSDVTPFTLCVCYAPPPAACQQDYSPLLKREGIFTLSISGYAATPKIPPPRSRQRQRVRAMMAAQATCFARLALIADTIIDAVSMLPQRHVSYVYAAATHARCYYAPAIRRFYAPCRYAIVVAGIQRARKRAVRG